MDMTARLRPDARGLLGRAEEILLHPWFLPACFAAFVVLRLLVVLLVPVTQNSDAEWYLGRAIGLAAGQGYVEGSVPAGTWPPGWPMALAVIVKLFGSDPLNGQLANLVFSAASFWLLLGLGRRIFRSETVARAAVLLLTFYPNNIAYTGLLLSEVFVTFVLLLGLTIFLTRQSLLAVAAAGLLFGYAALTKSQFAVVPGLLLAIQAWGSWRDPAALRRLVVVGLVLGLGMAAVLGPWMVRNYRVFGVAPVVSTNSGMTMIGGNHPGAWGGHDIDDALLERLREAGARLEPPLNWPRGQMWPIEDAIRIDRLANQVARDWIRDNPGEFARLVPRKLLHFWAMDGEAEWFYQRGSPVYDGNVFAFRAVRGLNQIYYLALLAGAAAGLVLLARGQVTADRWAWFGVLFMAFLTLITMVFSGQSRLHFPMMPFILLYDGVFIAWLLARQNAPVEDRAVVPVTS